MKCTECTVYWLQFKMTTYNSVSLNLSKFAKTTKLHAIFLFTKFFVPTYTWTLDSTYPHRTVPISRSSSDFAKKLNFGQESFHFSYYLCVCTRTSYKYWSWINNISINALKHHIWQTQWKTFWLLISAPPPPSPRAIGSWKWKSFRKGKSTPTPPLPPTPSPHPQPPFFSVWLGSEN